MEKLLDALKEIIRIHDDDWSEKYRETGLASDMAGIARRTIEVWDQLTKQGEGE